MAYGGRVRFWSVGSGLEERREGWSLVICFGCERAIGFESLKGCRAVGSRKATGLDQGVCRWAQLIRRERGSYRGRGSGTSHWRRVRQLIEPNDGAIGVRMIPPRGNGATKGRGRLRHGKKKKSNNTHAADGDRSRARETLEPMGVVTMEGDPFRGARGRGDLYLLLGTREWSVL